ncbi:chromosome segregation protein SMC [Paramicrobacterium chengjingii]|uniref:Chromosome partition protein Smc n=1 Tax=Paramicrobacterium chengjingii TaxID=2769067 RepID=A0ABX6YLW1_9MICO|nr:chromosome segregation protein SMC [Microbacterium chengjingii]QPZ39794.1 chromosome segregation protein SMC [Microbacterium chengjingii]
MYLKSLTLKGFKSFAQSTSFAFEPGVTCVVGPNGSGKSNVVDALAWVMGEQGVKNLRGGKMEDVIFAGTSTRGPLGRAEVTLTIDNSDGALPIEYSEVTISRTLFRNGGSEYAINGEGCRLLDVQELLSDSGLGREMHVIVGQGRLDTVLHASPEERRGFIEEAAGILKHRRRKEKTVRKLEAMETNLTRLSDLAGEIRRQLKPLGRQAEIAREAQTIAAVVRDARARILADDVVTLRTTLDSFGRSESERHTERIVLQEQLEQKQLRIAHIEKAQLGDSVDEARRISYGLDSVQQRLRNLHTLTGQRIALLDAQTEQTESSSTVSEQMIADAESELTQLRDDIATAEQRSEAARAHTAQTRERLDAVDQEIQAQSDLVSQHDLDIAKLSGQVETAASKLAAVRGEKLRQQNSLDAAVQRRDEAQHRFDEIESTSSESSVNESGLDEAYELAQSRVFDAEAEIDRLRDVLHGHERERDALAAKTSALSRALDIRDGAADMVAAKLDGVTGIVADSVQVTPGYEAAVTAGLGTLADAVLAVGSIEAEHALSYAKQNDLGRVEVVLADGPRREIEWPNTSVVSAASVVTAPDGVLGLLDYIGIVANIGAARTVRKALGEAARQVTFVTEGGDVITEHVLRGGSGGTQGRIELLAERDAADERHTEVVSIIERSRFELDEQRVEHKAAKEQSQLALQSLRELDAQLAAETEALNKAKVQYEASVAECDRLTESLAESDAAVVEAERASETAKASLATAQSRPRPILDVSARDELAAERERARESEVEARFHVETARERVSAQQEQVRALTQRRERERQAAEAAARRAVIRRRQLDAATRVSDALPDVLASIDRSVREASVTLAKAEEQRASQNQELTTLRQEESALRQRLQAVTEDVHGLELQIYEKKLQLSSFLERAGSELGLVEDVLVAEYGPDVPVPVDVADAPELPEPTDNDAESVVPTDDDEAADDVGVRALAEGAAQVPHDAPAADEPEPEFETVPYDRAGQQRRLEKAERQLQKLGRVNPLALEEFAALEQRHKFLTEQLTDLTNTRKDLLTIIDELDDKMQTIFRDAFDDTKRAFSDVFPILFPGGTGSIALTNPDDMLNTGIDVAVRPAGKKIERLSLLSGGERSLAAVALLIAIFKARPSPFYIMDEVEAALDDANLGRLLTIFESLREASQLIVITHQKRTMEIADALYGVSMRQDGVSAVVGQRLAEERERASA